jgi:hypothetical protein
VGCFEGVDVAVPAGGPVPLPVNLIGVLAPVQAAADAFAARWPQAPVKPRIVALRPTTQGPARYGQLRMLARERLGLPDATRLVLGVGPMDAHSGWERFASLALDAGERHNGVVFVWLGGGGWDPRRRLATGVPMGLRRLFVRDDREVGNWLRAADAYLGCRAAGVYDPGAVEALSLALPVAVRDRGALTEDAAGGWAVDVPAPGTEVDWLLDQLYGPSAGSGEPRGRPSPAGGLQYPPPGQDWIEVCLGLLAEPDENRRQLEDSE